MIDSRLCRLPGRLARLLDRFLERRSTVLRGLRLPEGGKTWKLQEKRDGVWAVPFLQGLCGMSHGTGGRPIKDLDDVDEMGFCLARLPDDDRATVILGHLGEEEGWEMWKEHWMQKRKASVKAFAKHARNAHLRLKLHAIKAGLI